MRVTRYAAGLPGNDSRPKVIALRQLTVVCRGRSILQDIYLDIFEGEAVALLGAPGAGKSTLLACLQGRIQPLRGEVFVLGKTISPLLPEIRQQIGIMPQDIDLKTRETVAEYLQRFANYYRLSLTNEQIERYCAQYQLMPSSTVYLLNSLQRRIFSLALALVHDPRLILLDEPIAGLSPADAARFALYLQRVRREGRTIVSSFTQPLANIFSGEYDLIVRLEQGHLPVRRDLIRR